ncbi:porin [Guyparkeria sp.]|uniref:porin n=1 Tax=Guyparkeria sp. TaxID=2035736 RepID=UPI003970A5F0
MKKNIIAMAVAAAVAAPAAAMADTTMYGKIHASFDVYDGDTMEDRDYGLASNSSRIGFKGKEDISDSLAFIWQFENTVDWADGAGWGGQRNTFVGFSGDWGTAIAGRHDTPFKGVSRKYDLFGDTVGDSRALLNSKGGTGTPEGWDLRTNNTVAYVTPDMGGFSAKAAYVTDWDLNDEDGDSIPGGNNNEWDAYSLSAGYSVGGFMIDAAYEQHNAGDLGDETGMRVGAGYKMGGIKVVGLYQTTEDLAGDDQDIWGLGAGYTFGKNTIKAQYYTADDRDNNADTAADLWAVGYDYKLSKQTTVYAAYGSVEGDGAGNQQIGSGTGKGVDGDVFIGEDSNSLSVGLVHKF